MKALSARGVMRQVANAIPAEFRREIIIVGSLAAAHHFFGDKNDEITTNDVDGMLSPNAHAVRNGTVIARKLFGAGWTLRKDPKWGRPGDSSTPDDKLPILRLHPPGSTEWTLELAAAPPEGNPAAKVFQRLAIPQGHFGLHSYRFLALAEEAPLETEFGIFYARPEMMALANLLHHPRIGPEKIGDTPDKRSNKDLGRVLALAWLSTAQDPAALETWPPRWLAALQKRFPDEWQVLAARAGDGLRLLLDDKHRLDLDEAVRLSNMSLLRGRDLGPEQLRATARRLLAEAASLRPERLAATAVRRIRAKRQ